jgi:excisionase family DNA binding protein
MPQSRRLGVDAPADGQAVRGSASELAVLSLVEPLLDAPAAAVLLNVRASWVRDAAREGVLPCVRVGRHLRFTKVMLEDWLVEQFSGRSEARSGAVGRGGAASSSRGPADGVSRRRCVFRPETDAALLASLGERPVRGGNGG